MKSGSKVLPLLGLPLIVLATLWLAETRPADFSNITYMEGLVLLEITFVAIWHYEKAMFPALLLVFVWAGSNLPLAGSVTAVRWVFLAAAAAVGLFRWLDCNERLSLDSFHVMAALCVFSAVVSGLVSTRSQISLLKALSLFLLFLFGSCGARVALVSREARFFRGLLLGCEIVSYVSAFCYIVLHFSLLGNPNSLGAVMGVAIVPVLVWGILVTEDRRVSRRRLFALCLAAYLLVSSASRAGLLASAASVTVMCVSLRRGMLLLRGALALLFLIAAVGVLQPSNFNSLLTSATDKFIYKGKIEQGVLGSRKDPWQETVDVIKQNPWFGSGFGTDLMKPAKVHDSLTETNTGSNREHGSAYLSLLQYMGLLGIVPFVILLMMILLQIRRVCLWMWQTANPQHYAIPLATVCFAGLIHASFEDWMFSTGYHLSVLFWTFAFLLNDLRPRYPHRVPMSVQFWQHPPQPESGSAILTTP